MGGIASGHTAGIANNQLTPLHHTTGHSHGANTPPASNKKPKAKSGRTSNAGQHGGDKDKDHGVSHMSEQAARLGLYN
jgi:hypothetical protein